MAYFFGKFAFNGYICRAKQKNNKQMFGLGTQETLVTALIILLLFGGKKIPELMKGLGKGVKSFKEGLNSIEDDKNEKKEEEKKEDLK